MFFRKLSTEEEARFRAWARTNYEPGSEIPGHYHPVVVEECARINRELAVFVSDDEERES